VGRYHAQEIHSNFACQTSIVLNTQAPILLAAALLCRSANAGPIQRQGVVGNLPRLLLANAAVVMGQVFRVVSGYDVILVLCDGLNWILLYH